jgi:hypothetical protein
MNLSDILSLPKIGSGNFRDVYRSGDLVFKVEYGEGIEFGSNLSEYANFTRMRTMRLPDNVVLPWVQIRCIDGVYVILMPFINGEPVGECFCLPGESHEGCIPPGMERDLHALGMDVAYGNIILKDSTYYIVDLDADLR